MINRKYLLILLLFFTVNTYSQNAGLAIFVHPSGALIKVNGVLIKQGVINSFFPGKVEIQVWSPHYKQLNDTAQLSDYKVKFLRKKLEYTEDYKSYMKEESKIDRPYRASLFFAAGLALVYAGSSVLSNSSKSKTESSYTLYSSAIALDDVERYKSEYDKNRKKYNIFRKISNGAIVCAAVVLPPAIIFSRIYIKKHHKIYNEKPNPSFSMVPGLGIDNSGNLVSHLYFNF